MGATGAFDWMSLIMKGATIRGTTIGDANARLFVPQLLEHHRAGRFPFERMLTYFDFAEINEAMQAAASGAVIKPVLRVR
jgi:aryl-alcohol dehydrogenase